MTSFDSVMRGAFVPAAPVQFEGVNLGYQPVTPSIAAVSADEH